MHISAFPFYLTDATFNDALFDGVSKEVYSDNTDKKTMHACGDVLSLAAAFEVYSYIYRNQYIYTSQREIWSDFCNISQLEKIQSLTSTLTKI